MELKGREIFSSPYACDSAHKTSELVIKRARTPCVLGGYLVASGIEPRPSGLKSDALTTRLPTAWSTFFLMLAEWHSLVGDVFAHQRLQAQPRPKRWIFIMQ
ncbi:hypothetical protein TNCV_2890451 [Trichonephila clavipes]|nr:hypothetical protein TNCV_2890451 [Trichonephila clavipes]